MQIIIAYIVTAIVFLGVDAVMLRTVIKPVFEKHLGDAVLDSPRLGAAVGFYLVYVGGIIWFASWPAMQAGDPIRALWNGAILGAMAYGTYEFTSFAVMRDWSIEQVAIDFPWGIVLTGVSAWIGVLVAMAIT